MGRSLRVLFLVVAPAVLVLLVVLVGCRDLTSGPGDGTGDSVTTTGIASGQTTGGQEGPGAGAAGLGDPYYPLAGNGGYDVRSYEIVLAFDPATGVLSGTTGMTAVALHDLSALNLDFSGLEVASVEFDGKEAGYRRDGQELTVECPEVLLAGETFSTQISYSGTPAPIRDAEQIVVGWHQQGDNVYTLDEPVGAQVWFPANDHPSDKATYVFKVTVPEPYVAVANGALVSTDDHGASRTYVWEMRYPCASYLAAMVIGRLVLDESTAPNGVRIRNYVAADLVDDARALFAHTGDMLAFFADVIGPYPFDEYGVVIPDADTRAGMENQTMTLFGRDMVERGMSDPIFEYAYIPHELAHQWFGDSVTPARWQDVWLNEGFATYASWLWVEHDLGREELSGWVDWAVDKVRAMENSPDKEPPPGDPGTADLFGVNVYQRGALTLHALRSTVGDEIFFGILREWVSRYQYANADTEDFIALVAEKTDTVDGFDADAFFDAWLFAKEMPDLP